MEKQRKLKKEVEQIIFRGKTEEEIKKIKEEGQSSEVKIGGKRIQVPTKGPVDRKTKRELEKAVKRQSLEEKFRKQHRIPFPTKNPMKMEYLNLPQVILPLP